MKDSRSHVWAYAFIGVGALSLATKLGWFGWLTNGLWIALFLAVGAAFLYYYSLDRQHWWALIPGTTLLGLGIAALSGDAAGSVFLALPAAGFAAIFAINRRHWWAVSPAAVAACIEASRGLGAVTVQGVLDVTGMSMSLKPLTVPRHGLI